MTSNTRISLTVLAVVAVAVGALVMLTRPEGLGGASSNAPASVLVRPDSHRLSTAADGRVTVVEFLDLECESCGAAFSGVEQLRGEYADRVTFVMRYFPIPSHRNAELAARAVEAAGQQGQLEPMYRKMFETQAQWGDQQVSHRETFLGFARDLGFSPVARCHRVAGGRSWLSQSHRGPRRPRPPAAGAPQCRRWAPTDRDPAVPLRCRCRCCSAAARRDLPGPPLAELPCSEPPRLPPAVASVMT